MSKPKKNAARHPFGPWTTEGVTPPAPGEPLFVSGLGAVIRPGAEEEPKIQVRLTAFRASATLEDDGRVADWLNPSRVWWEVVPVGYLPLLHVGQIWLDGELLATPKHTYEQFDGVEINASTCERVWDWETVRPEEGSRNTSLIPVEALRVNPPASPGLKWPGSKRRDKAGVAYVRVKLPGTRNRLLIPCTEIARYYYMNSGKLAYALFTEFMFSEDEAPDEAGRPPRHLDEIYNLERSGIDAEGKRWIWLRMRIDNEDRFIAARLRYDDHARREALAIGAILQRREQAGEVPLVEAGFPFEGTTNLRVHGTWLHANVDGVDVRHFLVFSIVGCSGPWPFDFIVYDRDNRNPPEGGDPLGEGEEKPGGGKPGGIPGTPAPRPGDGEVMWPDAPTSLLRGIVKTVLPPPTFDPPGGLKSKRAPLTGRTGPGRWPVRGPDDKGDTVNTPPGGYSESPSSRLNAIRDAGGTEPEEEEKTSTVRLQVDLQVFERAVLKMAQDEKWGVEWVDPRGAGRIGRAVPVPVHDREKKRPAWAYINRGTDEERRRHALVARVQIEEASVYLIEVERRPKEDLPFLVLADEVGTLLPRSFLDAVLLRSVERGARKQGIWGEWEGTGLHFFSERHSPRAEGADVDAQREYVALFAKHLATKAQKVFLQVRLARGETRPGGGRGAAEAADEPGSRERGVIRA